MEENSCNRISTAQSRSNSRSIQGVFQESFAFFQESHFGQNSSYGVKKVYTDISYDDKNFIFFDYCKQSMPERQFGMKCRTNPNCQSIRRVFLDLSTFFSRIDIAIQT